jgi:hypothetical protein
MRTFKPQRLSRPVGYSAIWPEAAPTTPNERTGIAPRSLVRLRRMLRVRVGVRVRALFREVLACSVRGVVRDDPRRILGLVRTREVLAKVPAKRLRIATDLECEFLRRKRLLVCHFPSLHMFVGRRCSMADAFVRVNIRTRMHTNSLHLRTFVNASDDRGYPPYRPPEGPERELAPKSRAKRAHFLSFRGLRAACVA